MSKLPLLYDTALSTIKLRCTEGLKEAFAIYESLKGHHEYLSIMKLRYGIGKH